MTTPSPDQQHIVTYWRDRQGQRWNHFVCTCGATYGSPSEQDRDDQATPHREAGEQFRTRTVTA